MSCERRQVEQKQSGFDNIMRGVDRSVSVGHDGHLFKDEQCEGYGSTNKAVEKYLTVELIR